MLGALQIDEQDFRDKDYLSEEETGPTARLISQLESLCAKDSLDPRYTTYDDP